MTDNRLGLFIEKLKKGVASSSDPFNEDYFDLEEQKRIALEREPLEVELLLKRAQAKAQKQAKEEQLRRVKEILRGNN
jgi:hypothetical protein